MRKNKLETITEKVFDTGRSVREVFDDFPANIWGREYFEQAIGFLNILKTNFNELSKEEKAILLRCLARKTDFPLDIQPVYTSEGEKSLTPTGYTLTTGRRHPTKIKDEWIASLRYLAIPQEDTDEARKLIQYARDGGNLMQVAKLIDFLPMLGEFVSKEDLARNRQTSSKSSRESYILSDSSRPFIPTEHVFYIITKGIIDGEVDEAIYDLQKEHPKIGINSYGDCQDVGYSQWGSTLEESTDYGFSPFFKIDFDRMFGVEGLNEFTAKLSKKNKRATE